MYETEIDIFCNLTLCDIINSEWHKIRLKKRNGVITINYSQGYKEFEEEIWPNELKTIAEFCEEFLLAYRSFHD